MKRFLKFAFAAILAVGTIATVFAFTSKEAVPAKKLATVSFLYTGPRPATAASATNPANWTAGTPSPVLPFQVLHAISFDDATYPLDANGKPDFASQPTLTSTVSANATNPSAHGTTINGITFYFSQS